MNQLPGENDRPKIAKLLLEGHSCKDCQLSYQDTQSNSICINWIDLAGVGDKIKMNTYHTGCLQK